MTDWRFLVFQDASGPLVFGEHHAICDGEDDIALANWRVVEKQIFGGPQTDHRLVGTGCGDIHRFGTWGDLGAYSGLERVTPNTMVIRAGGEIWIRAALIEDYVSALADHALLCEETHVEVTHEIAEAALESWVFDDIGRLLGEESEDNRDTWDDLSCQQQEEIWSEATDLEEPPYWVTNGEFIVDFDRIMPRILARLPEPSTHEEP